MNYIEARVYLDEVSKYGSVLGLESMRELLRRLGDPQNELKFIHISGTNGKGSVLAYLSTILSGAGYRLSSTICRVQCCSLQVSSMTCAASLFCCAETTIVSGLMMPALAAAMSMRPAS